MEQRINPYEIEPNVVRTLRGLGTFLTNSPIEHSLIDLLHFRVSQINGCAYCLDMHSKDLRAEGETEQRLFLLDAWREASCYTDRERAALEWAEAVTKVAETRIPDEAYTKALQYFSDKELVDLTMAVITINCWNRMNVAFRVPAGNYQPAGTN